MRLFKSFAATLAISISVATLSFAVEPLAAESTHKEFSEAWEARETRYSEQFDAANSMAKEKSNEYFQAIIAKKEDVSAETKAMMDAIEASSYLYARGRTLMFLREHMKSKPSAAKTELWMQEMLDLLQGSAKEADRRWAEFNAMKPGDDLRAYFAALEVALIQSGQTKGEMDELTLIDQNLASYYEARSVEQAKRRTARAAFLSAIGASLQQSSSQAVFAPTVRTRCTTFGGVTNCTSN